MPLPAGLEAFFWDVRTDAIDPRADRDFVISRIAEHGDDAAIRWLRRTYDEREIAAALEARRSALSARTVGLWRIWLRKPEDWCARMPSRPLKGVFWRS